MNPNPNANPRHHYHHNHHHTHHGSSGTSNVQGYPGNSLPNQLDDRGSCSGGLNIPNHPHSPMPPSSWVKNSPQTTPTNLPLTSINSSNAANSSCCSSPNVNNLLAAPGGMPGSSYGASNSNSFQQQHPHQFYTETPDVRYTPGTGNNKLNSTSNRPNQNLNMVNTGMQFYSNENHTDSSCYFQQQQQQQHPTNFDCDHQNSMGKNNPVVCDNNGSSGDLQNPNNTNFYGFYSSHNTYHNSNHSHQQQQQQPSQEFHHSNLNSGSNVPNPNEGDYSRFHGFNMSGSANSAHSSHQQQQLPNQIQNTPLSCQQQSQGYFGMIGNRHAVHPQSQSPYALCQQNPHQNAPFRRNSIESFSTEPGDLPYNVKYGCNFNTMGNIPFGDVIKRETGTMHVSTWQTPREPSLNSLSHQHGNGNSQGYFFNNNSSTNNNLNPRASEHNFQNQHQPQQQPQQQQFQNFKSCSFDMGHHSSMEIDQLKPDLQAMKSNNMTVTGTPSAVKHRSLSCSMMNSPFQFSSNSSSNDDGHFNFLDNIGNHPSCSNISNSPTSGSNSMSTSRNVNVPVDSLPVSQKPPPMESSQQNDCNQTEPGGVFVGSRTCPTSASNVDCGLNPVQDTKPLQNIKSVQESASSEPQEKSQTCESTGEIPTHVIKQEDIIQQTSSSGDTNDDPGATSDFQNELGSNMDEVSEKDIDSLIISTTTAGDRTSMDTSHTDEIDAKSSPSAPRIDDGCHNLILEALDDADVSNSSCSLGLLVNTGNEDNSNTSLSHLAITGANDSDDNDNESCHSGMSSLGCASKALSDICSSDVDRNRLQNVVGMTKISHSPQKISKRSFSEADKDLVINTTAVSFRNTILIPAGWKREIVSSTGVKIDNNLVVFYVSPSGTKLRTWDELKNYICSDGTCKCGLSCPLRLEQSFSFDPKVTNSCQAEESSVEENVNETTGTETPPRLLCNHKRKIPKSEDSPLISSTRDDLGDCGDLGGSSKKRRRISEGGSNNAAATKVFVPQTSPSINTGNNVSVPFSQQSPDTTTQTPQTDMSPASSVSSEQSVFGGNRSTNSTPTPVPISTPATTGKTLPTSKGPSKGKDNTNFGFPWPQVPVSQSPTPTSASVLATSPNTSTMTFWPNPNQTNMAVNCIPIMTTSANSNRAGINPTGVTTLKKSGCQHHLTSKGVGISSKKRASSPCPNIDVRQIPLEQNRPPPRQILHIPTSATSHTITHDNPSVSLFPITSTTPVESPLLNMNTGFSISPVITSTNNSGSTLQPNILTNTLQFAPQPQPLQATTTLVNSNLNIFPLPLQFQRVPSPVVTSGTPSGITTTPANTFIHQSLPSSITISMVGGSPNSSQVQLPSSSSPAIMNNNANCNSGQPSQPTLSSSTSASTRDNNVSEKSPLQLVQDVVDRFQSSKTGADGKDDAVSVDVVVSTSSSSPKVAASVEPSKDGDNKPGEADSKLTESDKSVRLETTKDLAEKREGKPKKPGSDSNTKLQSENVSIHPCTVSTTPVVSSPSSIVEPEPPKITVVNLPLPVSSSIATSTAIPISATVSAAHNMNLTQPLVATSSIMSCATSTGVISVNAANSLGNHQPIILQQQPSQTDIQTSSFITTTAGHGNSVGGTQSIRYPLFQTIQPFFLNSTGAPGGQLIISPQPTATAHPADQQPFIYEQQTQGGSDHQMQSMLQQTTMVLDPSVCGNTPGAKKKKKRLSKKQQQQQAQLHLQQQLLLQQLAHQQAQVQQQVAQAQQHQTIPLTIFPQSFNLGPQGFSLQPMNMNMNMNFFPTPTILTLPNLILNPADGTLFLQPSPLQTTTTTTHPQTVKLGQFPIAAAPNTVVSAGQATLQAQQTQSINVIAPKKDGNFNNNITLTALPSDHMTLIKTGPASADIVSDDSRQNPTPDSSTNDCQLGLNLNPANSITISIPPMANNNAINISSLNQSNNKKLNVKARAVSSSSGNGAPKRIFTQKQILPKIDSTTPSVENS